MTEIRHYHPSEPIAVGSIPGREKLVKGFSALHRSTPPLTNFSLPGIEMFAGDGKTVSPKGGFKDPVGGVLLML